MIALKNNRFHLYIHWLIISLSDIIVGFFLRRRTFALFAGGFLKGEFTVLSWKDLNFKHCKSNTLEFSYDITVAHLKKQHSKYYEEHRSFRMAPNDEKVDCRKARKRKASEKVSYMWFVRFFISWFSKCITKTDYFLQVLPNEHSGSLSPLSDYSEESDSPPSLCRFEYEFKNCNALDALG